MIVIVYAYVGVFTAHMTVPKLEPIIETLDQLAQSSHFRVTVATPEHITKLILVREEYTIS